MIPVYQPGVAPSVADGEGTFEGYPDKEIIRAYITRKLPRIRHCYEKALLVAPTLSGKVTTKFQISPSGSVQGASAEGLGNSNVEGCIQAAVKPIESPKPSNGG